MKTPPVCASNLQRDIRYILFFVPQQPVLEILDKGAKHDAGLDGNQGKDGVRSLPSGTTQGEGATVGLC